jgi:hypothetical protein
MIAWAKSIAEVVVILPMAFLVIFASADAIVKHTIATMPKAIPHRQSRTRDHTMGNPGRLPAKPVNAGNRPGRWNTQPGFNGCGIHCIFPPIVCGVRISIAQLGAPRVPAVRSYAPALRGATKTCRRHCRRPREYAAAHCAHRRRSETDTGQCAGQWALSSPLARHRRSGSVCPSYRYE